LAEANRIITHVRNDMDVVGHNDKTAAKPAITGRAIQQKRDEPLKRDFVIQDTDAAIHANSEEIRNIASRSGQTRWRRRRRRGGGSSGEERGTPCEGTRPTGDAPGAL